MLSSIRKFFFLLIVASVISYTSVSFAVVDTSKSNNLIQPYQYRIADKPLFTITGNKINSITKIKPIPIGIFAGTYAVVFYLQHIGQTQTIWKNRGKFHIAEDNDYALFTDKAGHFYGSFLTSYALTHSLLECGFNYDWAIAIGTFLGLGYSTYVEILDGFAVEWGFSPSDFYSDLAGGLFFLGYSYIPFIQNFTPKFMYFPPRWFNSHSRVPSTMFIDDYSAHTLWLSFNVYNVLPEGLKKYWPRWLEISFGYAARNLCGGTNSRCDPSVSEPVSKNAWGNRKYIIALDYDLVKLLPDGPPFWNWLKQSLNFFKLPSPAIEFGSPTRFYLLYPFPLRIGQVKF